MQSTTYSMTESMDATDYAFYLAYGMTQEEESIQTLVEDVTDPIYAEFTLLSNKKINYLSSCTEY